jgi:hypothetical protein
MDRLSRRWFLQATALAAGASPGLAASLPGGPGDGSGGQAVVHTTDLFRPYGDPDDHWDLATQFALAYQHRIRLQAVMIDFPPAFRGKVDPDVAAVAQMSYLTGKLVPIMVGCPRKMATRDDTLPAASPRELGGVLSLVQILRDAPQPIAIHIVGTTNDVALAARRAPRLFAEKCAAIYLNAGSGTTDPVRRRKLEYNVRLNPASYAALFDLPCPIYWLPCFEEADDFRGPAAYGTYYRFRHADVLPHLSPTLQNYFAEMYRDGQPASRQAGPRTRWLETLLGPRDEALLADEANQYRNMWSTAGFFHGAGLTVLGDGQLVALSAAGDRAVYEFQPVHVQCSDEGVTEWRHADGVTNHHLFHVRDTQRYAAAMTAALRSLLAVIP